MTNLNFFPKKCEKNEFFHLCPHLSGCKFIICVPHPHVPYFCIMIYCVMVRALYLGVVTLIGPQTQKIPKIHILNF